MEGQNGEAARPWRTTNAREVPSVPSISRAFNMFTAMDDGPTPSTSDHFFVPSYLEGSAYVQKLEAHFLSQSKGDQDVGWHLLQQKPGALFPPPLPPGSHRGLAHSLVERYKPQGEDEELNPLPTGWNKDDMWGSLDIPAGGLGLRYNGPKGYHEREHEACAVRANSFMPPECGIYYYEVQVVGGKRDEYVPRTPMLTTSSAT